jgi:hypothetical protein
MVKLRSVTVLVHVHVVLESSVQQTSEKWLEVVGLIRMDVLPVVGPLEEVATSTFGHKDGVYEEEIVEPLVPQQESARPDKYILRLRIWAALASTSPTELSLIEVPLEIHKVLVDLPLALLEMASGLQLTRLEGVTAVATV